MTRGAVAVAEQPTFGEFVLGLGDWSQDISISRRQ